MLTQHPLQVENHLSSGILFLTHDFLKVANLQNGSGTARNVKIAKLALVPRMVTLEFSLTETLLQRMLGQKKTRDDRLTTQTVQEFFTHFPNMQEFVVEEMKQAGAQHQQAGLQLHPSLFPILTILTKLTAGPQQLSDRFVVLVLFLKFIRTKSATLQHIESPHGDPDD